MRDETAAEMSTEKVDLEVITKFVAAREKHPKAAAFALQAVARELLGESRMNICYRYRVPEREVEIWHNAEAGKAFYCGLMKCGMAWVCPLCSARLSEKRREILRAALDNSRDRFLPVMVSYTLQHTSKDRLKPLLAGMLDAYRNMRQTRLWRTYKDEYIVIGECRTLEITYGDNGFHPHFHVLMFLDIAILKFLQDGETYELEDRLYKPLRRHLSALWIESLAKMSLQALDGPSLHVRGDWETLDDYLTKSGSTLPKTAERWGVAEEMTKAQRKKARAGGLNVWDFLLLFYAGDTASGNRFREYYEATKGRSMMQWSPGLLARLQVAEQSEKEMLKQEPEAGDNLLMRIPWDIWKVVLAAGAEGRLLDEAASGEWVRVERFLQRLGVKALD